MAQFMSYPVALYRSLTDTRSAFYQSFPGLGGRAYLRESFLVERSAGKRVLHFGFLDAPFTAERYRSGALLHQRLATSALSVYGVDIGETALAVYREMSNDFENAIMD